MSDIGELVQRIRSEFSASDEKLKAYQSKQVESLHARQQRLMQLESIFDKLANVWRPRLEALAKEFGDRIQATPDVTPGRRSALLQVKSPVASIRLQFSATSDSDVTKLILAYDLDILPLLMQFERHAEIELPLDDVNPEIIGRWLDDRIVTFVKTYLSIHENQYYLKDIMVEDPVALIRFPQFAAGATRQKEGQTYYFINEETAIEFDRM